MEATGRWDLVSDPIADDWNDAGNFGASFFLDGASKALDVITNRRKQYLWEKHDITAGDVKLEITNIRSIKEVWLTGTTGRLPFEKVSLGWLRSEYPKEAAAQTNGQPLYWAPAAFGLSQNQLDLTAIGGASPYTDEFTYDIDDLVFGSHFNIGGIVWYPPADTTYTISIFAQFFEKTLSNDSDENFWTNQFPEILLIAAQKLMEITLHRNFEGWQQLRTVVLEMMQGVDFEVVEEEISGINQMTG